MANNITCKKAVDLISKKEEGKISLQQRFALWQHLASCSLCRHFSKQNKWIIAAARLEAADQLSAEEKEEIVVRVLSNDQQPD